MILLKNQCKIAIACQIYKCIAQIGSGREVYSYSLQFPFFPCLYFINDLYTESTVVLQVIIQGFKNYKNLYSLVDLLM